MHARRIYAYAAMGRPHAHDVVRTCLAHQHVAQSVYYDVSDAHMSLIDTACARCTCICVLFYGDFTCLHLICTPTPSHIPRLPLKLSRNILQVPASMLDVIYRVDRITRCDGIHGTRSVRARRIYAYAAMGRPHAHDVART